MNWKKTKHFFPQNHKMTSHAITLSSLEKRFARVISTETRLRVIREADFLRVTIHL